MANIDTNFDGLTKLRDWWGKVKQNFININTQLLNHTVGTADKHAAQDITYSGNASGSTVKEAIDNTDTRIDNLVITGTTHDPFVTDALIDVEGENFGPSGTGTYLDGRLRKWEQKTISHLADYVSVKDPRFGAKGDGVTDDTLAIQAAIDVAANSGGTVYFPPGIYRLSTITSPASVALWFSKGAKLKPENNVVITIKGQIIAGNYEIFTNSNGTINLDESPNEYNLAWFETTNGYINERWDFARKGMAAWNKKIVRFPKPYDGQAGTLKLGTRIYWLFNNEIKFEDAQNACIVYLDGEFRSAGDCANFMNFEDAAKPENIYFYGDLQVNIPAGTVVSNGINFKSAARVTFYGNVVINGAQTSVKIGGSDQVAAVGDIKFFALQCSFFSQAGVLIYGKSGMPTQSVLIDHLSITAAQTTGLNAVEIKGLARDIRINDIFYATDVAKDGYAANDAENVVYVESNAEGTIMHVFIGSIYQANANNGLKIDSAVLDQNKILDMKVQNIFGKYSGNAAIISYCTGIEIENIENNSDVIINNTAYYVNVKTGSRLRNITDNGNYTLINGIGKQSRGAGVLPSAAINWPIGCMVRETTDNKVYLRIQKTGVDANDFILLN